MKNHYNALELERNCTAEEIKNSYLKLTKKYHPDKNKSDEAKKKILEINEAYSVLRNKSSRYQYDERLQWYSAEQKFNQARASSFYTRPQTYNEYVYYYQNVRAHGPKEFNRSFASKQFSVVLCCCMLMMFGAGLRIMYAWSEAHHRRVMNHMAASKISEEEKKERLKYFKKVWEKSLENNKKKSE